MKRLLDTLRTRLRVLWFRQASRRLAIRRALAERIQRARVFLSERELRGDARRLDVDVSELRRLRAAGGDIVKRSEFAARADRRRREEIGPEHGSFWQERARERW